MTAHLDRVADERIVRKNRAIRDRRLYRVQQVLTEMRIAIDQMLDRMQSAQYRPEKGVMILTAYDGWKDHRDAWRINPYRDNWIIDDHGQIYMYLGGPNHKVIPYSMSALRDRSMSKFDRQSMPGVERSALEAHDSELESMHDDINRMCTEFDLDARLALAS